MKNMHRKAAVFLHGLAADDREWMLERLSGPQRKVLHELLAELRSLGIPRTPTVLSDASRLSFDALDEPAPRADAPSHVAALAAAAPQALWTILEDQPDSVLAAVLSAEAWPWRETLLELMPPLRRHAVEERTGARKPLMPKALDALLCCIAQRLPQADDFLNESRSGSRPQEQRRSWWEAGRRKLAWQS